MHPGWAQPDAAAADTANDANVAALARLPMERLCPVGFVFVWADKVGFCHLNSPLLQASLPLWLTVGVTSLQSQCIR